MYLSKKLVRRHSSTALHVACERGHCETAKLLLAHEADMEAKDLVENTPLHVAAQNKQTRLVQTLLDGGADPNSENQKGSTPLHMACGLGSEDILESLLQHGALVNKQNQCGNTPLHLACQANEVNTVEILIGRGAELNILNTRQQSPIHIAAEMGHVEICKLLLTAGADIEQKENCGKTPLFIAASGNFTAIVDMMIESARLDFPINVEQITLIDKKSFRPKLSGKWRRTNKDEGCAKDSESLKKVLYKLAYKRLDHDEWKRLATHWGFTDDQIKAIKHQDCGPLSYKEHGLRMLLIWAHGLSADVDPVKELCESLVAIGKMPLADKLRKKNDQANQARRKGTKQKCTPCSIS